MSLHIVCFLFQLTKRTALHGSADDPRATDPGGGATDSSKHKDPTLVQFPTGAALRGRGDATDNSNKDPLPEVSTDADDPRVNDPRGVATESANKKLPPTIQVSTGAADPLVTAQRGVAIEEWMLHLSTCRHTTVLVATAGAVTMATGLVTATDGAVTMDTDTDFAKEKSSLCSKPLTGCDATRVVERLCKIDNTYYEMQALTNPYENFRNCSNKFLYCSKIYISYNIMYSVLFKRDAL